MVFTSHVFLFYFLPALLLLYFNFPYRWRNLLITVASYLFYGWSNPWYILLLLMVTALNYGCGVVMARPATGPRLKFCCAAAAIALSLSVLGLFKYAAFCQTNLNHVLAWFGADAVRVWQIALPLGISFYTFHAISYTVNVYRGTTAAARSFADFACYIALFPKVVTGPIMRYGAMAGQLAGRTHSWERFSSGVTLFSVGFAKKVLLANPMAAVADAAFGAQSLSAADAWFGAAAYAFQIYFDFCGYSDMAVGLGRMFGFEFIKNFNAPYRSESITDFWRRWHISLSTFLRDYLYFPLGGNRKGPTRTYLNLIVVMLLGGLWHGANWTFVAWGAFHGALLAFERSLGKQSLYHRLPRSVRVAVTFVLVLFSWVLFRSATLGEALGYLGVMFGMGGGGQGALLLPALLYTRESLVCMAACALAVLGPIQAHDWSETTTWPKLLVAQPLFWAALLVTFAQSYTPFLYTRF